MKPNVNQLLLQGREGITKESRERRKQTTLAYHVSSGGMFLEKEQTTTGVCHRTTLAKFEEIETTFPNYKLIMFEGGKANEEAWMSVLRKSWAGQIKREEEIPVKSTTAKGTPIVGNPDIVLCENDVPQLGLELKCASSYYTVRNVYFNHLPSLAHLCQSLHNSSVLNVPFELWYTSRVDFHIPPFDAKNIPSGDAMVELNPKGQPKKVYCTETGFQLDLKKDKLYYKVGEHGKAQESIVTLSGIKKFFDFCDFLREQKDLGPRPANIESDGGRAGYAKCDYCEYRDCCDKHEDNYDKWFESVRDLNKAPF
jgi:hypothetical protein